MKCVLSYSIFNIFLKYSIYEHTHFSFNIYTLYIITTRFKFYICTIIKIGLKCRLLGCAPLVLEKNVDKNVHNPEYHVKELTWQRMSRTCSTNSSTYELLLVHIRVSLLIPYNINSLIYKCCLCKFFQNGDVLPFTDTSDFLQKLSLCFN